MRLKSWPFLAIIFMIALVVGIVLRSKAPVEKDIPKQEGQPEHVHYHAGFQVYIEGKLVNFSDVIFMHIEPCEEEGSRKESPEHQQIEKAHLHDGVGDVVHVHREGAVWGDLFKNINFPIDSSAVAYINGQPVENILDYPIKPFDSIVIIRGEVGELEKILENAVTRQHIEEVEAISETC